MDFCATCARKFEDNKIPVYGVFRKTRLNFCGTDCAKACNLSMVLHVKKNLVSSKKDSAFMVLVDEDTKKEYFIRLNEKNDLISSVTDSRVGVIFKAMMVKNNPLGSLTRFMRDEDVYKIVVYFNNNIIRDITSNGYGFTTEPRYEVVKKNN